MGTNSLSEFLSLINDHIEQLEQVGHALAQAEALLEVALGQSFLESSKETVHNYLWVLSNLIMMVRTSNEQQLLKFCQMTP